MQPVYDFRTGEKVNYKSKLSWLTDLITKDSTFNEPIKMSDYQRRKMIDAEKDSDEEESFFKGSVFHEMEAKKRAEKKKIAARREKNQAASAAIKDPNNSSAREGGTATIHKHPYLVHRPATKLKELPDRQRAKSNLHTTASIPLAEGKSSL